MSKASIFPGVAGLTLNALLVRDSDHGDIWTGSGFETLADLTDAEIEAALIAWTELTSGDSTHIGYELEIPATVDERVIIQVYEGVFAVGNRVFATAVYDPEIPTALTITSLDASFTTLKVTLADRAGWGRNTEGAGTDWDTDTVARLSDVIKTGMRRVYYPDMVARNGKVHEWSFLFPTTTLATSAPYSTGTVTIASGVVTLADGTFPTWAASGELAIEGVYYPVSSRDSGSQITLVDTSLDADAGTLYSLVRYIYDLPTDFDSLRGEMTYAVNDAYGYGALERVSVQRLREFRRESSEVGYPRYLAMRPATFATGTGQRWQAMLQPTPSAAFTFDYTYKAQVDIDAGTNVYFRGGPMIAAVIEESCLAVLEQRYLENGSREHTDLFRSLLLSAIETDKEHGSLPYLGVMNGGDGEGRDLLSRRQQDATMTIFGESM